MRESERSEDALTKARQAMMLVNNQLTDLQVKAKEYEQRLHEEEAKRGIRISSTPPAKEEESWWDQLLAPFTGAAPFTPADVGLCCDSSDAVCMYPMRRRDTNFENQFDVPLTTGRIIAA
jgi:hypothetical protein